MNKFLLIAIIIIVVYISTQKGTDSTKQVTETMTIMAPLTFRNEVDVLNPKTHVGFADLKYFENMEYPYLNASNPVTFRWINNQLILYTFNNDTKQTDYKQIEAPFNASDIFKIHVIDNNVFKIDLNGKLFHYKYENGSWTVLNRQLGTDFQTFKEIIRDPDHKNNLFALETNGNIVYFKTIPSLPTITTLENNHTDFIMYTRTIPHDLYHTYLPFIHDH